MFNYFLPQTGTILYDAKVGAVTPTHYSIFSIHFVIIIRRSDFGKLFGLKKIVIVFGEITIVERFRLVFGLPLCNFS